MKQVLSRLHFIYQYFLLPLIVEDNDDDDNNQTDEWPDGHTYSLSISLRNNLQQERPKKPVTILVSTSVCGD